MKAYSGVADRDVGGEGMRVSDANGWKSPGGETTPSGPPTPGSVPPTPPVSPAAPFAPPAGSPPVVPSGMPVAPPVAGPGGWAPPPGPGLIPLRPLGLGDILGSAFGVLRRNPGPVVGIALIVKLAVALVAIAIVGLATATGFIHIFDQFTTDGISFTSLVQGYLSNLVTFILGIFASAVLQGIITFEVSRGALGEKLPLRQLWRGAKGRIGALIGWSVALGAIAFAAILLFAFVIGLSAGLLIGGGTSAGITVGVIVIIVAILGAIVLTIWISTKLSFVPSVIVLERARLGAAIRRSWRLTSGTYFFWRTFGIELLVSVIISTATSIILIPVSVGSTLITVATQTSTSSAPTDQISFITEAVTLLLQAIVGAITVIISTASFSLLYVDARIRREGLDLDLMRYTEARTAGRDDLPDPFLPRPQTVPLSAPPLDLQPPSGSSWS